MNKYIKKISSSILLLFLLSQSVFAEFSDISTSNKNYDAIIYLQQNGIIKGYDNGTFMPERNISRAELLKIILEGAKTQLDVTNNPPFTDLKYLSWELPYIRKAYSEKWISGYEDLTFRASRPITKAETLKIIGEVNNWQLPVYVSDRPFDDVYITAWYTPYISYAKAHNYLEETGIIFSPDEYITRGEVSEIIYRTLGGTPTKINRPNSSDTPTQENPAIAEPSISYKNTPTNFYENITLSNTLPNIFYKNEVYIINGEITGTSSDTTTVILDKADGSKKYTFTEKTVNNNFSIPVYFSETGKFDLGLIPGETGQSKAYRIEVVNGLPEFKNTSPSPSVNNPKIKYSNDITTVEFDTAYSTLKRFTFFQNYQKASFYSRQNVSSVPINYAYFKNFDEGTVSFYVESASADSIQPLTITSPFSKSTTQSFDAVTHSYSRTEESQIKASPPDSIPLVQEIAFNGTAKANLSIEAFVTKPNGFVDNINLNAGNTFTSGENTYVSPNSNFSFSYVPTQKGQYIVEIVDEHGMAVLNHPVYVGKTIPLIPDFFDLTQRDFFEGTMSFSAARSELLNYINSSRQDHGLSSVTTTTSLNSVAQSHAEDMANNDYFSHINLKGQSPEDRRMEAGLPMPISENIAKDVSITFAHHGLMRSGNHRKNILQKDWTTVGLGISLKDGYLYVVEEFSTDTFSQSTLENYKNELLTEINKKRSDKNIPSLIYDPTLEKAAMYLNNKAINENVTLSNAVLSQALDAFNIKGSAMAIGRVYTLWSLILSSIINQEMALQSAEWKYAGIDIELDNKGFLNTTVIVNTP